MSRRYPRWSLVLKRLAVVPGSLLLVVIVSFLLVALIPQSTARAIAGQGATNADVASINRRLGLNQPILTQLGHYLTRLAHGNLGTSYYYDKPVLSNMLSHVPATIELILPALVLGTLLGVGLGTLGAYRAGRAADRAVRIGGSILQATPEFLLGLLLLYLLFFRLHLLPAPTGQISIAYVNPPHHTGLLAVDAIIAGQWSTLGNVCEHLVLPVLTIALPLAAVLTRITRAVVGQALASDHVAYGRSVGLKERRLIRYALIDARTPLMTFCATIFAGLVGGDVIVEDIFNWNGVGAWALTAITNLDIPSIQGFVLFSGMVTLLVYIALDVISVSLDPRIRIVGNR
jgi:ABC-type dipeptide/oligopeptide/nickel transport system permease component